MFVTHSGLFQADEVTAIAIVQCLFGQRRVVRTRNNIERYTNDKDVIVIDVGGLYDPKYLNFDHHQKTGAGSRSNGVPYAAAGLIWRHFGVSVVQKITKIMDETNIIIAKRVDKTLIQQIDAIDTGYDHPTSNNGVRYTTLSGVVSSMNYSGGDNGFHDACSFMRSQIYSTVMRAQGWSSRRRRVLNSVDGDLLILSQDIGWKEHLLDSREGDFVKFCVSPKGDAWNVQQVPYPKPESFHSKMSLPREWWGLNGKALSIATGVEDAIFCHRAGFVIGAKTKDSAIKLAKKAITLNNKVSLLEMR